MTPYQWSALLGTLAGLADLLGALVRSMRRLASVMVVLAAAVGCGQSPISTPKPLVVASFYPIYEFARQVAGDCAEVVSLVPPGVEPHDWEPSPQDFAKVQRARLFIFNGAGFEPWVEKLAEGAADKGTVVVRATEGIPLVAADRPRDHEHGRSSRGEGEKVPPDPHVWLDPVLAQSMVENIQAALARVDPANAAVYSDNALSLSAKIETLHQAFETGLRDCARRDIIVSHAAFGYLARRYRLSAIAVMGLAPDSEPSPAQLGSIVRIARERKVKYIFFETLVNPKLAETLAREVGAQTLLLNPIEGLTKGEAAAGKGYLTLMEQNLTNLRTALECR